MIAKFGNFEFPLAERYRFERELGSGAMGTVYLARDLRLGRAVAIKLLHPMLTNELGIKRFQGEIRIAAGLHHQNIVALHESGEADGRLLYVMDYLGGETLRARLQREKQLPVDDALRITEQVADALQYAHDHGVVHRDVKPENIILAEGRACILDFGLARALGDVDAQRLTASGLAVGTPHYLSPEQAGAEKEVGPAADQYGLACVLYEMLVGEPPFTGPTASAIAMRHITEAPPPLKGRRRSVPDAVDAAVRRAMEKVPADRWGSVQGFMQALVTERLPHGMTPHERARRRPSAIVWVCGIAAAFLLTALSVSSSSREAISDLLDRAVTTAPDSNTYAVFQFNDATGFRSDPALEQRIMDELGRWRGIHLASQAEVQSASKETGARSADQNGRAVARRLSVSRYITGDVSRVSDSVRVHVLVGDAARRMPPFEFTSSFSAESGITADGVKRLAYRIMLRSDEKEAFAYADIGTLNFHAASFFLNGRKAEESWNLPVADSAFSASLRWDPNFAAAAISLADVRAWQRDDAPDVAPLLRRAVSSAASLNARDQLRAKGLLALTTGRFREACAAYDSLLQKDSLDFRAWIGVGRCNFLDRAVLPPDRDHPAPRFRSSQRAATLALLHAFELLPRIDSCCIGRADEMVRQVLFVSTSRLRVGPLLAPDSTLYGAHPELKDDTIAFIPHRMADADAAPPATTLQAVHAQRDEFFAMAARRVAMFPSSAEALEELSEAMELRGDASVVDTVRRARQLTRSAELGLNLAVRETWLRLKKALPANFAELVRVRRMADSILAKAPVAPSANASNGLASLAALIGDANTAARIVVRAPPTPGDRDTPPQVLEFARTFLAFAAMGGPMDSLAATESRLTVAIDNGVLPNHHDLVRSMWLLRGAVLALPGYRANALGLPDTTLFVMNAERAYLRGDKAGAKAILSRATASRARIRPADITIDALLPQAWLFVALGDTAQALATIVPTLNAIGSIPVSQLASVPAAATLVRAMSLRASLQSRNGAEPVARQWAAAVRALTGSANRARTPAQGSP